MKKKKIKNNIIKLRNEIIKANYKYYNSINESLISDYEFDKKLNNLKKLEKLNPNLNNKNSPTQKIGEYNILYTNAIHHKYKMYSLSKSYNYQYLIKWDIKLQKKINKQVEYICEYKYDGIAISLVYKYGNLIEASTRGDGLKGQNITDKIKYIKSIPLNLKIKKNIPKYLEFHGEIIISNNNFIKLNNLRNYNNNKLYTNARSAIIGSIKFKNNVNIINIPLECLIYSIHGNNIPFTSQYELLKYGKEIYGLNICNHYQVCSNIQEVFNFIKKNIENKNHFIYPIDGIVIKVNNFKEQNLLGFTDKYPRWAIAYKIRNDIVKTKILDVTFQIGKTGVITPVAELNPIQINKTIIKRVLLYNIFLSKKYNICYNDTVLIEKRGGIIPKIIDIDYTKRKLNYKLIKFIQKCPSCNYKLIKYLKNYYCINEFHCPAQLIKKIEHFVSKKAMNINYLGIEKIKILFNHKIIKYIYDIYYLKKEVLMNILNINDLYAKKIILEIKKSKNIPFYKVFYALSIKHIGENISKKLINKIPNIKFFMKDNFHYYFNNNNKINGVGNNIINNINNFFSKKENIYIINQLINIGLNFEEKKL